MTAKGVMGIPSKPAYRSRRNAPTRREQVHRARMQIAAELQRFNDEPFPNGAAVAEWNGVDGGIAPDGTFVRCIS